MKELLEMLLEMLLELLLELELDLKMLMMKMLVWANPLAKAAVANIGNLLMK